jgi:NADH-quinone oxidoreductase subunit L
VLFTLAMLTALLTAFYTFRAYFRTFWGEEKIPPEAGSHGHGHTPEIHAGHADIGHASTEREAASLGHGHAGTGAVHGESPQPAPGQAHESPPVMTIPLIVLAVGAVFAGIALGPTHLFARFLARTPAYRLYLHPLPEHEEMNWLLMLGSAVIALAGVAAAYWVYVVKPGSEAKFAADYPGVYNLSQNRFYLDELYKGIIVIPARVLAKLSSVFDMLVDGIVDLVGLIPSWVGTWLRPIQNGLVQFYALAMILGLVVFLGILTWRGGR